MDYTALQKNKIADLETEISFLFRRLEMDRFELKGYDGPELQPGFKKLER